MTQPPILYSFRRCPYAMRARMGLIYARLFCEVREIILRNKPKEMLNISPKGTVPVLYINEKTVLDESLDILCWAIDQHDPEGWKDDINKDLIQENDTDFKKALDRYKYATRYPGDCPEENREKGTLFLKTLNTILKEQDWLSQNRSKEDGMGFTDVAIFPFVRQFSKVDPSWFDALPYISVREWLHHCTNNTMFKACMHKYDIWQQGQLPIYLRLHDP